MKAERKHELEHNQLDDLLVKATTFIQQNGLILGIVVVGLALGVGIYTWRMATNSISADAGLWEDYFLALSDSKDPERELESIIDEQDRRGQSSALPILWARLSVGNLKLSEGTRDLFEDREAAVQSLEEAEKNFLAVEKHASRNPELRDRANFGLAEVYESLSRPEDARKYYGLVAKASPESALGKLAARGERRMAEKNNQEFLTWFAQQKPIKKPSSNSGLPPLDFGNPPETPGFSVPPLPGSNDKPITPGLKIPSKLPDESSEGETGTPKEPASDDRPGDAKPSEEKPADEKPAEQKPDEDKATDEKPSADQP